MEVTNISPDTPHRFVPPWNSSTRYTWQPGETLDVPEDVANAVLAAHAGKKLIMGRPRQNGAEESAAYETEQAEAGTYEDRQMVPRRGPGRPRKVVES